MTNRDHTIARTTRGFGVYADFTDSCKLSVRVHQSGAASGNFCWLSLGEPGDSTAAHLSLDQARTVADALLGWIADTAQRNAEEAGVPQ